MHESNCTFAHGTSELHQVPVLYKTRLCPNLDACFDANCTYAHKQEELHVDVSCKTAMCRWHAKGKCRNGKTCRFAHSADELRDIHGVHKDNPNTDKDYTSDQGLPVKVYSQLLQEPGILDSLRCPLDLQMMNIDSPDYNIIPETRPPCFWGSEFQKKKPTLGIANQEMMPHIPTLPLVPESNPPDQHISALVQTVLDLSNQVNTLEQCIVRQHQKCTWQGCQGSFDNSDGTHSGSVYSGSSPASSPRCQEKLAQLSQFSKELLKQTGDLMMTTGSNMATLSDHGFSRI